MTYHTCMHNIIFVTASVPLSLPFAATASIFISTRLNRYTKQEIYMTTKMNIKFDQLEMIDNCYIFKVAESTVVVFPSLVSESERKFPWYQCHPDIILSFNTLTM